MLLRYLKLPSPAMSRGRPQQGEGWLWVPDFIPIWAHLPEARAPTLWSIIAQQEERAPGNCLRHKLVKSERGGQASSSWGRRRGGIQAKAIVECCQCVRGAVVFVCWALKYHESLTRNQTALIYITIQAHIAPRKIKLETSPQLDYANAHSKHK